MWELTVPFFISSCRHGINCTQPHTRGARCILPLLVLGGIGAALPRVNGSFVDARQLDAGDCSDNVMECDVPPASAELDEQAGLPGKRTSPPRAIKTRWNWNLDDSHPCNIERVTLKELRRRHGPKGLPPLYDKPIIISADPADKSRREFAERVALENITSATFPPDFDITLSSSNSFSAHRRTLPLRDYLVEIGADSTAAESSSRGETFPNQLSNETWYFFGETHSPEWRQLLLTFPLPPCQTCSEQLSARSFGIGNRGSGVQWHVHGPGFAETVWGSKHWVLYPPFERPRYDPDYTSRHWMEEIYPTVSRKPHECTLAPREMLYFPNEWYHATINLNFYTVFISTFTTEHLVEFS